MTKWKWTLLVLIAVGVVAAFYGLHRLLLWMEERGWVYYWKKKPSGGAMSGVLTTMQQFVEPQAQVISEIKEDSKEHHRREEDQPSQVDEPEAEAPETNEQKRMADGEEESIH